MAFRSSIVLVVTATFFVGQRAVLAEHVTLGHQHGGAVQGAMNRRSGAFLGATAQNAEVFRDNLHQAVAAALGAGHDLTRGHLGALRDSLLSLWRSLAKNEHGRVDRRSLRYAAHRYLLKTRSLSIIGLEPRQQRMSSPDASMITIHAPSYMKFVLETGDHLKGFSLEDLVAMIAMLEELVVHAGYERLDAMFEQKKWAKNGTDSDTFLSGILQQYFVRWVLGNDTKTVAMLETNRISFRNMFDDWEGVVNYITGRILAFERTGRWRSPKRHDAGRRGDSTWHPFRPVYSYADIQALTGDMALTFGSFWHTECARVKSLLMTMDRGSTGRVKLRDFHAAALNGEWRFSESREYLRELGALDESSNMLGPRVIISNYLQGASNCIVSDSHFRVCCADDCESHMSELEEEVQSPTAPPEQILAVVERMVTNLNDDQPRISISLRSQLFDISNTHHGKVPIHGRLLAQWLHYVFPQDCAFPHRAGTVTSAAPHEFGDGSVVTDEELDELHAANASLTTPGAHAEVGTEEDWMTQWSAEEELVSSNLHLKAPWERSLLPTGIAALGAVALAGIGASLTALKVWPLLPRTNVRGSAKGMPPMWSAKAHFV